MATFRVAYRETFYVPKTRTVVVCETDDWVEAERAARVENWPSRMTPLHVEGIHPTHTLGEVTRTYPRSEPYVFRGCTTCEAPDNGCFAIHAPCGFDFAGRAMIDIEEEWEREHAR